MKNIIEYDTFMKMDLAPYQGEWIAICGQEVISHGKKMKTVWEKAKTKCPHQAPFITLVHGKETWIF